jgi:hypothetical protein
MMSEPNRQALSALAPIVEQARISWREGEAYDDWDAIASVLYENILVRSLRFAREISFDPNVPDYDISYPSYRELDFLIVEGRDIPTGTTAAFVGFAGTSQNFAIIKWLEVDADGSVSNKEIKLAEFSHSRFYLAHNGARITSTLTIEL